MSKVMIQRVRCITIVQPAVTRGFTTDHIQFILCQGFICHEALKECQDNKYNSKHTPKDIYTIEKHTPNRACVSYTLEEVQLKTYKLVFIFSSVDFVQVKDFFQFRIVE